MLTLAEQFEVSIFLTETSTRHTLLYKQKHFRQPSKAGLQSNSHKLTGATNDSPIEVEDAPLIMREESDDALDLQELPEAGDVLSDADSLFVSEEEGPRRTKRQRAAASTDSPTDSSPRFEPLAKRRRDLNPNSEQDDDKKKMAMDTSYDGFSIYGRVLCLVVKRKDQKAKGPLVSGGQAMMEDWITSTQMPAQDEVGLD